MGSGDRLIRKCIFKQQETWHCQAPKAEATLPFRSMFNQTSPQTDADPSNPIITAAACS